MGKIPEKRFDALSAEYEKEQTAPEESVAKAKAEFADYEADTVRVDKFMELARKYADFSELTAPMINEFVEKIPVHEGDRSGGERMREVEIYLKFIGKFKISAPEPTPEELGEQEELRRQRELARERASRYYERRKQRVMEARMKERDSES